LNDGIHQSGDEKSTCHPEPVEGWIGFISAVTGKSDEYWLRN